MIVSLFIILDEHAGYKISRTQCNIVHPFFLSTLLAIDSMSMLGMSFFLVKLWQPFFLLPIGFPFYSFATGFSISPLVSCLCFFTFLVVIPVNSLLIKDCSNEWWIDPTNFFTNNYSSIYCLIILTLLISILLNVYLYFSLLKYVKNKPCGEINNCQNSSCDVPLMEHEEKQLELTNQSSEKGSPESEVSELEKYIISENSLSNNCGITRADKRQLASILDEFWGFIFDCHGNLTKEAKNIGVAVLFDLPACPEAENENLSWGGQNFCDISGAPKKQFTYAELESLVIYSLRICLRKILKLNCSELFFSQIDGFDESLIKHLAMCEKRLSNDEAFNLNLGSGVSIWINSICGEECVWQSGVVLSFAIWSIRLLLELASKETRPELWGKYTFVLNRLQGLIDPIFCKPREILPPCRCLQSSGYYMDSSGVEKVTGKRCILELIKEAEAFCLKCRGRAGTTAGDVAFRKGKEILFSVLRRYKRRLSE